MKLKKIILKNIRSYEYQELEFPEGAVLLSGDIGSGKTSILLAIEFALFGLQPGQRGSALLRNGAEDGGVTLEFEVDSQNIIVERTLKKGKSISQDYSSISINGNKQEISVTELKNKVLEILNYPKEFAKRQNLLYKFTVYTPQEEMKQIIIQDSETRINTLRHVFGIDKYKRILENTSILLLKIREEKRIKEGATLNLESDKLELLSKERELKSKQQNLSIAEKIFLSKIHEKEKSQVELNKVLKKKEEKQIFQQELEKIKIMVSAKSSSMSDNRKAIEQLKFQIDEIKSIELKELDIKKLESELDLLKQNRKMVESHLLEISTKINSLNLNNKENEEIKQKLKHLEVCPTCLQDVNLVYKNNVILKMEFGIAKNSGKIQEFLSEKSKYSEEIHNLDRNISDKQSQIQELNIFKIKIQGTEEKKKRIEEIEKLNIMMEKDIELLNNQFVRLKNSILDMNKFELIFEEKQKNLDNSLREEKLAEIRVAELKKEITLFIQQIDEMKNKIKKTEELRKQLLYLSNLEDWLSKHFSLIISIVEKNVMFKLKSEVSKLFSEWFSMLVSDSFNVRLGDDFTPIIELQDYEIDYSYLSGGERTAIALAYRFALNQTINSILSKIKTRDFIILDEPTDGFSEQQLDKMRFILEQLKVSQLILVSHEKKIEDFVDHVIKFKKENGRTVVEG